MGGRFVTSRQRHITISMLPEPAATQLAQAEIPEELLAVAYVIFERGRLVGREEQLSKVAPSSGHRQTRPTDRAPAAAAADDEPPARAAQEQTAEDLAQQRHRSVLKVAVDGFKIRKDREPTGDEMRQIDSAITTSKFTKKFVTGESQIPSHRILLDAAITALESTGLIEREAGV